jgi:hypothetical protein
VALVAGIVLAAPAMTLQQVAAQLEAMHERTPRGGTRWHPSSVSNLLEQAERRGLLGPPAEPQRHSPPDNHSPAKVRPTRPKI